MQVPVAAVTIPYSDKIKVLEMYLRIQSMHESVAKTADFACALTNVNFL
jgi:hypothetical protein